MEADSGELNEQKIRPQLTVDKSKLREGLNTLKDRKFIQVTW